MDADLVDNGRILEETKGIAVKKPKMVQEEGQIGGAHGIFRAVKLFCIIP